MTEAGSVVAPVGGGRLSGLEKHSRTRREQSIEALRVAAISLFGEQGYMAPTVDDIARRAGVTRQTFYRHYPSKFALAEELFERENAAAAGLRQAIRKVDPRDLDSIADWVSGLFEFFAQRHRIMPLFTQIGLAEPQFTERLKESIAEYVSELDQIPPAMSISVRDDLGNEAWLHVYQLLDLCHAAAVGFLPADRDVFVRTLAERIHIFLRKAGKVPSSGP